MATQPDVYPLTPIQRGMLFHSISGEADAVYVQQLDLPLLGPLDVDAFAAAWASVQQRYAVLRTAFAWKGLPDPVQVVGEKVKLPLEILDWRGRADNEDEFAALRATERTRSFALNRAPLFRLVLILEDEERSRLVWTWHHAILDAWSVPILLRELLTSYAAHAEHQPLNLAPTRPFKDFVAWQRAQPSTETEAWWRDTLSGFDEPNALSNTQLERDEPSELGYGLEFVAMSKDEVAALARAARRRRVTLSTLAHAAWALLLACYSRRQDVVFGSAVSGRPPELEGIEEMVGITLNTLPVRVRVDPELELGTWLELLQRQQAEARLREHVALGDIQAWSEVPGGTPLFDSLLVFENFPVDASGLEDGAGLRLGEYAFVERANFPLTVMLEIRETGGGRLGVGWNEDRFDRETMRRLLAHMRHLLAAMAKDGPRLLRDLSPLDADERAQLRVFSRAERPLGGRPQTLTEQVEAHARATPDAPALIFVGAQQRELSYAELVTQAQAIAGRLRRAGVGRGDRVVVSMRPSPLRLAVVLGITRAGAAWVPVETSFPDTRLSEIVEDCGAAQVLVDADGPRAHVQGVTPVGAGFELADDHAPALEGKGEGEGADTGEGEGRLDDLAYIIYTSGSTGLPKGVAVTHRSADHLVRAQIEAFDVDPSSRVLQFASLSWDAAVSEIFTALCSGACVVAAPRERLIPSREMLDLIDELAVTHLTLPPSVLAQLPVRALPKLRTLVSAGEPCPTELARTWGPGRLFINAYGPTELTVCASLGPVDPQEDRTPTIGRPLGDARIYILDGELRPVPLGVVGELCVGGPGVAQGYWNRPAQTAASFIPDPFVDLSMDLSMKGEAGENPRMYRSGDLARFLPDGRIEFVGRRDQQLKFRGFRIEAGEIETVARQHPGVAAAAVDVVGEGPSARLVTWIVGERDYHGPQWWPSIAEYLVYDELAYHAMTSDERRNDSYRSALAETVRDRVVLEVGPGPEAILSRLCVEAGARKVYAVELLRDTWEKASARVRELGLEDVIEVIHADATAVELPELTEVCVSEIVGAIGGCEGSAVIMNGVRRLMTPDARMVPERSVTLIAPVELPAELLAQLAFDALPARYVERIFAEVGRPFDLRLSVRGLDHSHLLAPPRVFEDLDYRSEVEAERDEIEEFEITRAGTIHGFLVWLTLDCGAGPVLDILRHEHCWLPVFFPALYPGEAVEAGDRLSLRCRTTLCEDQLHPDYRVDGTLERQTGETLRFSHQAPHHAPVFKASPFYAELFATAEIPRHPPASRGGLDPEAVLRRLKSRLPEHMVPSRLVVVDELPLLDSGKLDRRALHQTLSETLRGEPGAPRERAQAATERVLDNDAERLVAEIWQELLELEHIGLRTNFFDAGGHSLLLIDVQERLKTAGFEVLVSDLFKYPTVEALADRLSHGQSSDVRTGAAEQASRRREARSQRSATRKRSARRLPRSPR